jgi:hypothetical protein
MPGKGIGKVIFARPIVNKELFLAHAVLEPIPSHVHGFGPFCFMVPLAKHLEMVLSTCIGVGGWGWPNSRSVVRMGTASWP